MSRWSASLMAASGESQMISHAVSQGYNASLVLRCGEELDEATASLVEMAESSGVAVSIRKECFVAGTLIHTREGEKAIEEIGEGDEVLSYNPQTQQTEYKPVVQTFTHEARELLNVGIEGESEALGVTPTHPFYVRRARDCTSDGDGDDSPSQASRGEWVAAKELKAGDLVRRPNGEWVRVEKVESRARGERVYNFEVADNHNYFVGQQGTLVHNICSIEEYQRLRKASPTDEIREYVNDVQGTKYDPIYGYKVQRFEADHIVPLKEIVEMKGFDRLTWKQKLEVINLKENFMGLGKRTNSAKQAKSWIDWEGHSVLGPIKPEIRARMIEATKQARRELRKAINIRLRQ